MRGEREERDRDRERERERERERGYLTKLSKLFESEKRSSSQWNWRKT